MALDLGRYGSREILNLQIFEYGSTPTPIMHFDFANTASTEVAGDRAFATGGSGGVRRIKFDGAKTETLTVETQIFSMEHLALLSGNEVVSGSKNIFKTEVLPVLTGKKVALTHIPLGTSTTYVYKYVNGVKTAIAGSGLTIVDKEVTFTAADIAVGEEVEVYYQTAVTSSYSVKHTAKGFPKYVKIVGDSYYADEVAGELVPVQKVYYKASLQPNYTITHNATGDPSSITMIFDLFCVKIAGEDVFGEEIIYEDA